MTQYLQIFALATGIIYMVMQIFQNRLMWYFNLMTASAACCVALLNRSVDGEWAPLWAQVLLNAYFFILSLIGIFTWRKYSRMTGGKLHIVKLTRVEITAAGITALVGAPLLCMVLYHTNDPFPVTDGMSMAFSIIAAWFLTRSHLEQWLMWIAADLLTISLYAELGAWWMVALYYCYVLSAVIGIMHWKRHGEYIEVP